MIVSLLARKEAAKGFTMNRSLQLECVLLRAQIEALYKEQRDNANRQDPSRRNY